MTYRPSLIELSHQVQALGDAARSRARQSLTLAVAAVPALLMACALAFAPARAISPQLAFFLEATAVAVGCAIALAAIGGSVRALDGLTEDHMAVRRSRAERPALAGLGLGLAVLMALVAVAVA